MTTDRFENVNSAYSFDGISNSIVIPNFNSINGLDALSISVWINKVSTSSNPYDGIFSKRNNSSIDLLTKGTENLFFRVSESVITNSYGYTTSNKIQNGVWHHIVAIFQGAASENTLKALIYIDGSQELLTFANTFPSNTGNIDQDAYIGKYITDFFRGKIDDIRIYNRTLTEQEIIALYNENVTVPPSSCDTWQVNGNYVYYNGAGNVGIGTDAPPAKFTVNGPILSTEVKVKTDVSIYPDFVFKPGYKLLTLQEVEQYINEYGHLPEVPKARDIEGGMNLGEMNARLLQKIEELMLYTIEQNKKIEYQNEQLQQQNHKIQKLEEKITKLEATSK